MVWFVWSMASAALANECDPLAYVEAYAESDAQLAEAVADSSDDLYGYSAWFGQHGATAPHDPTQCFSPVLAPLPAGCAAEHVRWFYLWEDSWSQGLGDHCGTVDDTVSRQVLLPVVKVANASFWPDGSPMFPELYNCPPGFVVVVYRCESVPEPEPVIEPAPLALAAVGTRVGPLESCAAGSRLVLDCDGDGLVPDEAWCVDEADLASAPPVEGPFGQEGVLVEAPECGETTLWREPYASGAYDGWCSDPDDHNASVGGLLETAWVDEDEDGFAATSEWVWPDVHSVNFEICEGEPGWASRIKGTDCDDADPLRQLSCDDDADGVPFNLDNCPFHGNGDQLDLDGDGFGDACDEDDDGDGVADAKDNCAYLPNEYQVDRDLDGVGDGCDPCPTRKEKKIDPLAWRSWSYDPLAWWSDSWIGDIDPLICPPDLLELGLLKTYHPLLWDGERSAYFREQTEAADPVTALKAIGVLGHAGDLDDALWLVPTLKSSPNATSTALQRMAQRETGATCAECGVDPAVWEGFLMKRIKYGKY